MSHTHPCLYCKQPVSCDGEHLQNYDGFPAVICEAYHQALGAIADVRCVDCDSSRCPDCGEILNVSQHVEDCPRATQV